MTKHFTEVHVFAELECQLDDHNISIHAAGQEIVVEVPNAATGLKLLRIGSPRGSIYASLRNWKRILDATQHRLELRIRGRSIGRIGHRVGSFAWRILGLPVLSLKPVAVVTELTRREST